MHDCLSELSNLSLGQQERDMAVPKSQTLILRRIRMLVSFKDAPGEIVIEAENSIESVHQHVALKF